MPTLPLIGAPGDLYNCFGKLANLVKLIRAQQASQYTALVDPANGVTAQLQNEVDVEAIVGSQYISLLDSLASGIGALVQQVAPVYLNRLVFRTQPQLGQTLSGINLTSSVLYLLQQMTLQGLTVLAQTVTATPVAVTSPGPHFTGVGPGAIVMSTKRPFDGRVLENLLAETLLLTVTQDSYLDNATPGNEPITLTGTGSQPNPFAFNWPLGSDCVLNLNAIDGSVSNGSGNLLANSGFDAFTGTANLPDFWQTGLTTTPGGPGVNYFQENTLVYGPGSSLRFLGDGATSVQIIQKFNDSTLGTGDTLSPLTEYAWCGWFRRDGGLNSTGLITVSLVDANGTVILDAAGNANSFTVDPKTFTTSFSAYTGVFRTPEILPATVYILYTQTTPYTAGSSYYMDRTALGVMGQTYTGGPFADVFSGYPPFVRGDWAQVTCTNSRGAGGTLNTWQTVMQLLLPIFQSGEVLLPSSASPNVSDTLIG